MWLTIDIETSPHLGYFFQTKNTFIQPSQIVEPTRMLSFAAKWEHENRVMFESEFPYADPEKYHEFLMANHDPDGTWDPVVDYAMMSRNVRGFMSLFHSDKPVVCKVHGFCVAGGTDMALCSDLLVIEDEAKIGYMPARVWGSPTPAMWVYRLGAMRAKRLMLTGDLIDGITANALMPGGIWTPLQRHWSAAE